MATPKHRLERRRGEKSRPRLQTARRILARVILGPDVSSTWPAALPSTDRAPGRRDLTLAR